MKITWNDNFFAGFTYVDMLVDGNKVAMSYSVEHRSPPNKNIYKIYHNGQIVPSEAVARELLLKTYKEQNKIEDKV